MKIRAGFCQFKPAFMEKEKNIEKMVKMISYTDADLLVFPELATTGYTFASRSELDKFAESSEHGLAGMVFRKVARENNCSIVFGFAERDGDAVYNSSMLINPDQTSYVYRKTHLFLREKELFTPGNTGFKVFEAKHGVKVGMMVCFDWIFPESARSLMLEGAQIIAHPANLVLPWCQKAMLVRSFENRIFTITANRTGTEKHGKYSNRFTGLSQIVNPWGERLLKADENEEETGVTEIEVEEADNKHITENNDVVRDRRAEYYHS